MMYFWVKEASTLWPALEPMIWLQNYMRVLSRYSIAPGGNGMASLGGCARCLWLATGWLGLDDGLAWFWRWVVDPVGRGRKVGLARFFAVGDQDHAAVGANSSATNLSQGYQSIQYCLKSNQPAGSDYWFWHFDPLFTRRQAARCSS